VGEEICDIKGVSSGESRFKSRVNSVLGSKELSSFAFWVMKAEGSWGISWHLWMFSIEESSIDSHLEDVSSSECWCTNLSVISGNTSKEWDNFLFSIEFEIVIDGGVNKGLASRGSLLNNAWDD